MDGSNGLRGLRGYIGLSLAWLAILGAVLLITRRPAAQPIEILPPPTSSPTATPPPTSTPSPLHVDVAGAVQSPGVYQLPPGSLIADAITAAGGPAEDADLDRVNKAVALQDGMQVYVPHIAQPGPTPQPYTLSTPPTATNNLAATDNNSGTISGQTVNINTATAEELDTLPGIGPSTAQKIIAGRPYGAIEDIMRVKGIGQATFNKLKDRITVQ